MRDVIPKQDGPGLILYNIFIVFYSNSSDGRVIRASASGAVDLGLIPS